MSEPVAAMLPDGRRLHLQHGPIDLIIEAWGPPTEVTTAYTQAIDAFQPLLPTLVSYLDILRMPVSDLEDTAVPDYPVAVRMIDAAATHHSLFVTPMAAVAGAVAEEVLGALCRGRALERAYVNNGGDIALHLTPGTALVAAAGPALSEAIRVEASAPVRGIATSGWRGRSQSLGIADAVSVLAYSAADADVAATLIANAVDLPSHPAIARRPATKSVPDSELGMRLVTDAVGALDCDEIDIALGRGLAAATAMQDRGLIEGAALWLQGQVATTHLRLMSMKGSTDA